MNVNFDIPMEAKISYHPVVKYDYKVFPVTTIGSRWCCNPPDAVLLHHPWGVAVDYESGNIYVTEQIKNRIQVFDSDGILLYKFEVGEMRSPIAFAKFQGRLFITQYDSSCLLVYDTDGEFICKISLDNDEDSVIHQLRGVAINQFNEDIYVCNSFQNKIHLLSYVYQFRDELQIYEHFLNTFLKYYAMASKMQNMKFRSCTKVSTSLLLMLTLLMIFLR